MAQSTYVKLVGPIEIKCSDEWTKCQKEQACAKAAGPGGLANISKIPSRRLAYEANRDEGDRLAAAYEGSNYAAPCMQATQGRAENGGRPMQADHIMEIQFGGAPAGPFMWLDASVNGSIGTQLNKTGKVTHLTGVTAANCQPAC